MIPEIPYHFTRLIHDYDKSTYCGTIMTSKLLRHNYGHDYGKQTLVVQLQQVNYGSMITTSKLQ